MRTLQAPRFRTIESPGSARESASPFFFALCGIGLAFLLGAHTCTAAAWQIETSIALGSSNVVQVLADPARPYVYAIDRGNSQVLFIDLNAGVVSKRLYVGQDPTSCDIDATTNSLYVANKSVGTGLPGSYQIAVVDLGTQTKTTAYVIATDYINSSLVDAVNVTAGRQGRLYYNSGNDIWNYGAVGSIDTTSGTDLGIFNAIKTRMVISSDKTRLYGQHIYEGNLGEMGVFDVSTDSNQLVDHLEYPPYGSNYGWGPDNYCLSGDNQYLAFGDIYFDATNLSMQYGVFDEYIYALNYEGTVAFGESAIWDTTSFAVNGAATKIQDLPFTTTVMTYDYAHDLLYAMNPADSKLYILFQSNCTLVPTSANCTAAGTTGSFTVEGGSSCCWTASTAEAWIQLTGVTNGCGTSTVSYNVSANSDTSARSGTILVNNQAFTISQAGFSCSYGIAPLSENFPVSGGTDSVTVSTSDHCEWTAASNNGFITILSTNAGAGNGTVTFSVAANLSSNAISGTMTIAGQTFKVTEAGIGPSANLQGAWEGVVQTCAMKKDGQHCKVKGQLYAVNRGGATATGCLVAYYLSNDGSVSLTDTRLKLQGMGTIKPNKVKKANLSVNLPVGVSASGQYLIAVLGTSGTIPYGNGSDNMVVFGPLP
ncbi:MAG TPA: BACON domain-containing carbohydrate-binding protein [Verrucomicrobiae bacterium]|nr:BACON domain-containing carbohydrate-binding protein [Verrucomicrobiae bacterium]